MAQNQIVRQRTEQMLAVTWESLKEQATLALESGLLPEHVKTAAQAIVIAMKGRELGVGTMEALVSIYVIRGKAELDTGLMLALAERTGEVQDVAFEDLDDAVAATVTRRGRTAVRILFGEQEAQSMGLAQGPNYQKQPRTMWRWRALSAALRLTFADALAGVYSPGEISGEERVRKPDPLDLPRLPAPQAPVPPCAQDRVGDKLPPIPDEAFNRDEGGNDPLDNDDTETGGVIPGGPPSPPVPAPRPAPAPVRPPPAAAPVVRPSVLVPVPPKSAKCYATAEDGRACLVEARWYDEARGLTLCDKHAGTQPRQTPAGKKQYPVRPR